MPLVELIVNMTNLWSYQMNEVDKINEQIAQLTAQRESVMLKERANVLAKMKADIKLYGFKTSDFKGALKTRSKRSSTVNKLATKTAK